MLAFVLGCGREGRKGVWQIDSRTYRLTPSHDCHPSVISRWFSVLRKAWCEQTSIQILFSLTTLRDSNVIISSPVACVSVWPRFNFENKISNTAVHTVVRRPSVFEGSCRLVATAAGWWFPGLGIPASRDSRPT